MFGFSRILVTSLFPAPLLIFVEWIDIEDLNLEPDPVSEAEFWVLWQVR